MLHGGLIGLTCSRVLAPRRVDRLGLSFVIGGAIGNGSTGYIRRRATSTLPGRLALVGCHGPTRHNSPRRRILIRAISVVGALRVSECVVSDRSRLRVRRDAGRVDLLASGWRCPREVARPRQNASRLGI